MMYHQKIQEVIPVVNAYFSGIFVGDVDKLRSIFHPECLLFADINGEPYFKHVEEYLQGVANRKSPQDLGETYKMEIINIEILGNNAMAKLHVPMLGFNYYDLLSFSKVGDKWLIVNKLFTHVES